MCNERSSTRSVASLLFIKTNTLARLSDSEEAKNVEARVADAVEKDTNDLTDRQTLEKFPFLPQLWYVVSFAEQRLQLHKNSTYFSEL